MSRLGVGNRRILYCYLHVLIYLNHSDMVKVEHPFRHRGRAAITSTPTLPTRQSQ